MEMSGMSRGLFHDCEGVRGQPVEEVAGKRRFYRVNGGFLADFHHFVSPFQFM